MSDTDTIDDVVIDEKISVNTYEPSNYKVIFLNDNTTPIDFVIEVLKVIFKHSTETATDLTMKIHNDGSSVVGVYSYEIAESKAIETVNLSRENGFALQVKMEKE
jgi:ATP-dependent Clp protease adaptor protein ClpS